MFKNIYSISSKWFHQVRFSDSSMMIQLLQSACCLLWCSFADLERSVLMMGCFLHASGCPSWRCLICLCNYSKACAGVCDFMVLRRMSVGVVLEQVFRWICCLKRIFGVCLDFGLVFGLGEVFGMNRSGWVRFVGGLWFLTSSLILLQNLIFEVVPDVPLVHGGSLPLDCSFCRLLTGISCSYAAIPSFQADALLNSQRYLLDISQINTISAHVQLASSAQPASSAVLLFRRHMSIFHGSSEASLN